MKTPGKEPSVVQNDQDQSLAGAGSYCKDVDLKSFGVEKFKQRMLDRYGQRYLDYRARWAEAEDCAELDFPLNLELDLIDACTLKCTQCLRHPDLFPEYSGYIGKGSRLTLEQLAPVLDECRRHGLPSVNIGGSGEPMLHPDFTRICQAVMDTGVLELRIISNGTRLTPAISGELVRMQAHMLSVSVDAFTPETYSTIRGTQQQFGEVVENIMAFLRVRKERGSLFPMLRVSFVRQPKNTHETRQFVQFWSEHADLIDVQPYMDYRKTEFSPDMSCNDPWKRLLIWADGHVGPCCGFTGIVFNLGSIAEKSLSEIWRGKEMAAIRTMLKERKFPRVCQLCKGARVLYADEC